MAIRTYTDISQKAWHMAASVLVIGVTGVALSACTKIAQNHASEQSGDISIAEAWSPEFAGNDARAVYLTIINSGDSDDRVIAVQSDTAITTSLHQSTHQHGIIRMQEMPTGLGIPARSTVRLEPGGTHVMMSGLERSFEVGDTFQIVIEFELAGQMTADAEIRTMIPE